MLLSSEDYFRSWLSLEDNDLYLNNGSFGSTPLALNKGTPLHIMIFGSCVTRDIFRVCQEEQEDTNAKFFDVKKYIARQSVISSVSKPLSISLDDVNLKSPFQKKLVLGDFIKSFQKAMREESFHYILVDFIDERFSVLKTFDSCITKSDELVNSKLLETIVAVALSDSEQSELWFKSVPYFINLLDPYLQEKRVIFHKARWSREYLEDGALHAYDEKLQRYINKNNNMLEKYYERFLALTKDKLHILQEPNNLANAHHKWGNSAIHYMDSYYESLYSQLKNICLT